MIRGALTVACWTLLASALAAHPVPQFTYDRTIQVKLTSDGVEVSYRLELLDFTAVRDIGELLDERQLNAIKSGDQLRDAFLDGIMPILADRLEAWQDDKPLTFQGTRKSWFVDENLKCDVVLFAPWPAAPGPSFRFRFAVTKPLQQETIHLEKGRIDLAFAANHGWILSDRVEPKAELKDRPEVERTNEEERQLRELSAVIKPCEKPVVALPSSPPNEPVPEPASIWTQLRRRGFVALLDSKLGLGLLLALAGIFGAAHALTPGHGKTLVAAYLVGQRGTIGHAFLLGLVTTLTHTGVVIILAAILPWLLTRVAPEQVQAILGFVGGLLIAGLGLWLLLRRLSGQADHVHVGGGHHHHHGPGGHHHHHLPSGDRVRVRDLVVLGISGGIVPCWDAIALLAMAIGTRQVWLGLPLLLSFSAGLAGVLVAIGILVVKVRRFGSSRLGEGMFTRVLPILSALAVTLLGIWLCFDSVRN